MSDIDKTIERVKELREKAIKKFGTPTSWEYHVESGKAIMPLIAELETANKRIAELKARNKRQFDVLRSDPTVKAWQQYIKSEEVTDYGHQAATDTLAIITAYEQSQKELEEYKFLRSNASGAAKFLKAELETANKRIAELEKEAAKELVHTERNCRLISRLNAHLTDVHNCKCHLACDCPKLVEWCDCEKSKH